MRHSAAVFFPGRRSAHLQPIVCPCHVVPVVVNSQETLEDRTVLPQLTDLPLLSATQLYILHHSSCGLLWVRKFINATSTFQITVQIGYIFTRTLKAYCILAFRYWHKMSSVVCLSSVCRLSSLCLFVTQVYCDKTATVSIIQFSLQSSPMTYLFCLFIYLFIYLFIHQSTSAHCLPSSMTKFEGCPTIWGLKVG